MYTRYVGPCNLNVWFILNPLSLLYFNTHCGLTFREVNKTPRNSPRLHAGNCRYLGNRSMSVSFSSDLIICLVVLNVYQSYINYLFFSSPGFLCEMCYRGSFLSYLWVEVCIRPLKSTSYTIWTWYSLGEQYSVNYEKLVVLSFICLFPLRYDGGCRALLFSLQVAWTSWKTKSRDIGGLGR